MFQPNGISLHVEDHGRQAGGLATRMLAFVALRDGCVTYEDELREHARRRLADLKLPDKIVFLEKLPKGISGKIQRTALKEFEIVAA